MFWTIFQAVAGAVLALALIPILIWALYTIGDSVKNRRIKLEAELEVAKKAAPYDDVEVSQPPNTKMFTLRLVKNNEVVFEKSYDKDKLL